MKKTPKVQRLLKILIFSIALFIWQKDVIATNYSVSGYWSSCLNGTYVESGTCNSKPRYLLSNCGNTFSIAWSGSEWILDQYSSDPCSPDFWYYLTNSSSSSTCPTTGWSGITVTALAPGITYSTSTFVESSNNDGSISNSITITHNNFSGITFTGSNSDNFVSGGKVTVSNIPSGLTASIIRTSSTSLTFTLTGTASSHANSNDIANLSVVFQNSAFSNNDAAGHNNYNSTLEVNFAEQLNVGTGQTYTTIASAISAATDYDILNLSAQTFTESNISISNKKLTIKGQGPSSTIIQAHASPSTASFRVFDISFSSYATSNIVNFEKLTIKNGNTQIGGSVQGGGAIRSQFAAITTTNCSFESNRVWVSAGGAWGSGGGALLIKASSLTAENCTFSGNQLATGNPGDEMGGGAIQFIEGYSLNIKNCTFSNNTSGGKGGGAIYAAYGSSPVQTLNITITNSTFSGNSTTSDGGAIYGNDGNSTDVNITNTIFYGNSASGNGPEIYLSTSTAYSFNNCLFSNNSNVGSLTGNFTSCISGQNPLLGSLADNGGYTKTFALSAGSPAINAGTSGGDVPSIDQRGVATLSTKDIGSYEYNPTFYYSQTSGDPATLGNWNSATNGSGSAPSNLTTAGMYIIQNGHTMTTTGALSFGTTGTTLEIQSGGVLTASSGNAVTFASGSSLQVDAGGTFNVNTNQTIGTTSMVGGKVNIAAGTTLTLNGAVTTTAGVFSGSSTSNLTIGTDVGSLLFDQTTPGTTNVIRNLVIGSGSTASLTLGNALNIDPTGSVTFNAAGTKSLTTGGFLTLKSSASGTAYIGNTNSATISGNLSVERYLPATGRKYRFLASPVVGATSSYWRNNGVNTAGVGIQITGSGSNFDASTSNNPSAFSYDEVNAGSNTTVGNGASVDAGWTAFTDGNSTVLTNGKGFRVLVRGDRTLSLTTTPAPAANTTTISVTGSYPSSPVTINTTKTAANANSGYNLVGNPYPSAIDWNAITKTNVSGTYYVYSPSSSSYQSWNGSTGGATQYISSGQAFLVLNTSASGSLSIAESHKTTGAGASLFKGNLTNHLRVALKYDNSNSDEIFIHFREDATEGQDNFDAPKLINASVNFASMGVDTKRYSINCLPALTLDREVALSVIGSVQANYSIILNDVSTFEGYNVFLVDNYLHTSTQVSNGFNYPVQLSSDSASFKDGRFKVVFAKSATGIASNAASQRTIIAYPNPVENVLNIDLNGTTNSAYSVYNQLGEVVLAGEFMQEKNALNTSSLSNGVYFIKVQNSSSAQTIKFIK